MANKKNKTSSILKSGIGSSRILRGNMKSGNFVIKTYSFDAIDIYKDTSFYKDACLSIAVVVTTIVLLAQLRALAADVNSAKLDQTPAFRFYKKRVIVGDSGRVTACLITFTLDEAFVHIGDTPEEIQESVFVTLDTFQGNERFIEKCSEANLTDFVHGHMSRIIGIMASCPSSNMAAFGLSTDCVNWNVQDVLSRIPCKDISSIPVEEVKTKMRELCGLAPDADGNVIPVTFDEKPYKGGQSVDDGCALEKDIFGKHMPIRSRVGLASASFKKLFVSVDIEKYRTVLNELELRKLQSAVKVGKSDLIKKYIDLAESRLAE